MLFALQLDRSGFHGVATGFLVAGLATLGAGLINGIGSQPGLVTSLLAATAGLLACIVGARGERRATTWLGAAVVVGGLSAAPILAFDPDDSAVAGVLALITASILIGLPSLLLRRLKKTS